MLADCDILGKDALILVAPLPSLPSEFNLKSSDLLRHHGYRPRLAPAFGPLADQKTPVLLIQFFLQNCEICLVDAFGWVGDTGDPRAHVPERSPSE